MSGKGNSTPIQKRTQQKADTPPPHITTEALEEKAKWIIEQLETKPNITIPTYGQQFFAPRLAQYKKNGNSQRKTAISKLEQEYETQKLEQKQGENQMSGKPELVTPQPVTTLTENNPAPTESLVNEVEKVTQDTPVQPEQSLEEVLLEAAQVLGKPTAHTAATPIPLAIPVPQPENLAQQAVSLPLEAKANPLEDIDALFAALGLEIPTTNVPPVDPLEQINIFAQEARPKSPVLQAVEVFAADTKKEIANILQQHQEVNKQYEEKIASLQEQLASVTAEKEAAEAQAELVNAKAQEIEQLQAELQRAQAEKEASVQQAKKEYALDIFKKLYPNTNLDSLYHNDPQNRTTQQVIEDGGLEDILAKMKNRANTQTEALRELGEILGIPNAENTPLREMPELAANIKREVEALAELKSEMAQRAQEETQMQEMAEALNQGFAEAILDGDFATQEEKQALQDALSSKDQIRISFALQQLLQQYQQQLYPIMQQVTAKMEAAMHSRAPAGDPVVDGDPVVAPKPSRLHAFLSHKGTQCVGAMALLGTCYYFTPESVKTPAIEGFKALCEKYLPESLVSFVSHIAEKVGFSRAA